MQADLTIKKLDKNISPVEEYLYGILEEKSKQRYTCVRDLILSNRQKIEPPSAIISFNNMFDNIFRSRPKKDTEIDLTRRHLEFARHIADCEQ
jgi:hypothetical protein